MVGTIVLHFVMTWESSTGNLHDLTGCMIGEHVTYPGSSNPYVWPDPAWIDSAANPTILYVPAQHGHAVDNHKPGVFDHFIVRIVQFSADQYYFYTCPETGEVEFTDFSNIEISRTVKQRYPDYQPCALYTITKLGSSASFVPNKITTCTPQQPARTLLAGGPPQREKASHEKASFADAPDRNLWKFVLQPASAYHGLGEPIFVDLQVTNLRAAPASIDLGGDGKTDLLVTVTGHDGRSTAVRLPSGGLKASGEHLLGAGATYTERLILNEWNAFREAGDYDVTVALVPEFGLAADAPPMADLHVKVGPRDEAKLRAMAQAFADQAIAGDNVADHDAAALALSHVSDPAAIPEMARVLASSSSAGPALVVPLARLGGASAVEPALNSPNPDVRAAADRALRALHDGKPLSFDPKD